MLTDDEIRDLGNNSAVGLQAVLTGGHLTVPEKFLVQTAVAVLQFLSDQYNRPVDNTNAQRTVVIDGAQLLKDTVNGANTGNDANGGQRKTHGSHHEGDGRGVG